jgi:diadenosine tetraphosphate (Ap4A) HIT family hydrolase
MNKYEEDCIFCNRRSATSVLGYNKTMITILDNFPVSEGHLLIISARHKETYFDLDPEEICDLNDMITRAGRYIIQTYPDVTGINIGMNCGESAGQTIMHFHCHVIPRRDGDCENPRGGVRGVIPEKMSY